MRTASVGQRKAISEIDFRRQIVGPKGLATMLGWLHVGFRAAQTTRGWRTPVTGELGKGWVDLVLVHPGRKRLLFRELKRDGMAPDVDQIGVLETLRIAGLDAAVWRPADLDSGLIEAQLR